MKHSKKRRIAYTLALILGITSICSGNAFMLPTFSTSARDVYAAAVTASIAEVSLKADKTTIQKGDTIQLTATVKAESSSTLTSSDLTYKWLVENDDDDEDKNAFTINESQKSITVNNNTFTVSGITATANVAGWIGGFNFIATIGDEKGWGWCSIETMGDSTVKDSSFEKELDKDGSVSSNYGAVIYGIDDSYSSAAIPSMTVSLNTNAANAIIKKYINSDDINSNEKTALENKTAQIYLYVEAENIDSTYMSASDLTLLKNKLSSGHIISMYLNMDFCIKIGTNAKKWISEPGDNISITVDTSKKFPSIASGKTRQYDVVRLHYDADDGYKPSATNLSVSNSGQKVTFSSNKFSVYALSYKDTAGSAATTSSKTRSSSSDDDDDDSSSSSKKRGSGSARGYYTKTSSTTARFDGSALSEKAKTASVPATVKIGGKTRNVTSIASYAFIGYSNLTSVTIGKNVKRIGNSAFSDCKKLKTLTINSKKLTKKGVKNSLKDSSVTTILVPKDKVKAYKKIFTKKNTGSKGKITVKAKK